MKNLLILFLFLFNLSVIAQIVNYLPSNDIIANPERGLQKYSKNISSSTGNYNLVNQSDLINWRTGSDKITVIYRYIMLTQFINNNSLIDGAYLANLQTDFNRIRGAGFKVILRPAYTDSYVSITQPNKQTILNHINQLSNIINLNKDVIISVQGGFIGVYGEWYYTGGSTSSDTDGSIEFGDKGNISNSQWLNRKEVVDAMLNNFDVIPIQLRYADAKRKLYGNTQLTNLTAYQNTSIARVGFYNDAFLNEDGDMGTYNISNCTNPVGTTDYEFIKNSSKYLPMNGETNGINPCDGGFRTSGVNAVFELNDLNFSTLNRDYHPTFWGNLTSSQYSEILRNLGYRLQLNSTTIIVGSNVDFSMNITNSGYANIVNEKKIYLVFKNSTSEYKRLLNDADPRTWVTTHIFSQSIPNDIPVGTYDLYLHIADKNLETRPEYSIRLANSDITFDSNGYNNLNRSIEIVPLTSCVGGASTWTGVNWIGGVLPSETRNTIINGNFDTALNGSFDCCNLTVNGNLIVNTADYVTVQNHIEVLGTLIVKNGGKLIPVNDTSTSNGLVSVERRTTDMKRYDYTYWSSPVNTTISQVLGGWQNNYTFEFITSNFSDTQTHINGVFQSNIPDGQDDAAPFAWTLVGQGDNMISGKGYASMIKSTPSTGVYPRSELVTFIGDLNTGVINYPLVMSSNGSTNNDDFNLVGNPYSSSIKANDFINENLPNISGTLAFWAHGGLSNTYSGLLANNFSTFDYAYYNLLGGTASSSTLGTPSGNGGIKVPTSAIGSGQGFLVEAENTNDLIFKPSFMDKVIDNTTAVVFFRTSETQDKKLWVSLSTELGLFSQQLIGYEEGTTLNYEKGWDFIEKAPRQALTFYSIENGMKYKIQARGDFNVTDVVKLGYKTEVAETFTITVDSIVGIENVYIKDYGVTHNLPYTFTSEIGEYNDRFELIYQTSLGTIDFNTNDFYVYPNATKDYVTIVVKNIEEYEINLYNLLGQKLEINIIGERLNMKNLSSGLYILEIKNKKIKQTFKIIKE